MQRLACSIILLFPWALPAVQPDGASIYAQKCASCHGAKGEGNPKEYAAPLVGERSVGQLAKYIGKTMPKDDPESLSPEESQAVAAWIHETFYSPSAQARNKPPRIELARLTVKQHRQAFSDLVASFRNPPTSWGRVKGLTGTYYTGRRMNPQSKQLERVDAEVNFDFKEASPLEGKIAPEEFSIRWGGSILAPDTGLYEFVVRSDHAVRLWVNDNNTPLIDAWVKSGNDVEFKGEIPLVGGRVYHLRLEFSKAKQGVDDKKKLKSKPAFVSLLWKRPGRAPEVIPTRFLSTQFVPEQFLPSTPFPPDDRSYGWERGTTVSKEWDAATTEASFELADYVARKMNELAGTRDGAADQLTKLKAFARTFAERAFRRPLKPEELPRLTEQPFEGTKDFSLAIKKVVLLVTKSPLFLYREVGTAGNTPFDVASRLSFALWDSIPDQELWQAASQGRLRSPEQLRQQARRMLADTRAQAKLLNYFGEWLNLNHAHEISKDPKRFPGFTAAQVNDLRNSLELTLQDVLSSEAADFRQLLLSDEVYLNGSLSQLYGGDLPPDAPFQKVKLNPEFRAGVITHPFLMTTFAYTGTSSPIHRGVFLVRGVLGVNLRPPQEAFTPLAEDLHPNLTTRERVSLQTKPQNCQGCHHLINGLGFTLENFDAIGRFRDRDGTKPVDSTGVYTTRSGEVQKFRGPKELGRFLAESDEVHRAFTEGLFHHLAQQSIRAYGPSQLGQLRDGFVRSNFNIKQLVVEAAVLAALKGR